MADNSVIILDIGGGGEGHRNQYYAFFAGLLGARREAFSWRRVFLRQPVLVPLIEDSVPVFALTCLVRALLGRRTAGFLFRPLPAIESASARMRAKRWMLQAVRRLPNCRILTILPFAVEPRFARIAHDWIYDPQFWDLAWEGRLPSPHRETPLAAELRAAANGRRICCALGRQDTDKGFDQFASTFCDDPAARQSLLFAFGGKVSGDLADLTERFSLAGGFACARFITDDELLDFYACADLVWSSYAPRYDQASGIFGRAMQMGIPVVVRKGSLLHRFCLNEGLAHVAFDLDCRLGAFEVIPPREDPALAAQRARAYGAESVARLRAALGLAPVAAV